MSIPNRRGKRRGAMGSKGVMDDVKGVKKQPQIDSLNTVGTLQGWCKS